MTTDPAKKLLALALAITRGNLRRPWHVQTSNSFRRIGTDRGDGDVLCAITQRPDGQPDLHAAPDVLDYIVAAHPFTIMQLIHERDSARYTLDFLQHKTGKVSRAHLPKEAVDSAQVPSTEHPPIASYSLGQRVTFQPGRGDRWYPGIVTRLESELRPDRSAWHMIFVNSTRDLPEGEWEHAGTYAFEECDNGRVRPAL